MTALMNEGVAPCGGPGGASIAKGSRRKAATPERTQECVTEVMTEGIAVPKEPQLPRARGARQQPRRLKSVRPCEGTPEGCNSRADSRLHGLGPD